MEKLFYTPQEVAKLMGIRPETVYFMIRNGELPALRVGSRFKILKDDFHEWIRFRVDRETEERKAING